MTKILSLTTDGSVEPLEDSSDQLFLAGIDEQGSKGYVLTRLEESSIDAVKHGISVMFECHKFLLVEAPDEDSAFAFLYEKHPLPKPKKYPLKNLTLIRYDCYSSMPPATFFHKYVKPQNGETVVWDPIPAADTVLMLVYCKDELKLPAPDGEFKYSVALPSVIKQRYEAYIE